MSRRRDLLWRRRQLEDMAGILDSMKALAYMETRKIVHRQAALSRVTEQYAQAAGRFMDFHPEFADSPPLGGPRVCILIGTERGFCGDFNQRLLASVPPDTDRLIAVGQKLQRTIGRPGANPIPVPGASVSEEVSEVLAAIVDQLELKSSRDAPGAVDVVYQTDAAGEPVLRRLLPPFRNLTHRSAGVVDRGPDPLLYLTPKDFFRTLIEHYIFTLLNAALYSSLLAENSRRVQHLDAAVRHLEGKVTALTQTCNSLRQEEITEEIEVILLSAETALQAHQRRWETS